MVKTNSVKEPCQIIFLTSYHLVSMILFQTIQCIVWHETKGSLSSRLFCFERGPMSDGVIGELQWAMGRVHTDPFQRKKVSVLFFAFFFFFGIPRDYLFSFSHEKIHRSVPDWNLSTVGLDMIILVGQTQAFTFYQEKLKIK